MLTLITSPDALLKGSSPDVGLTNVLSAFAANGNFVILLSNHPEPAWFAQVFNSRLIRFFHVAARQNGEAVRLIMGKLGVLTRDVLTLAVKLEDLAMAKNGGTVLLGAGWSVEPRVRDHGIRAADPTELGKILDLTGQWTGAWWFSAENDRYSVRSLSNLSSKGTSNVQAIFGAKLTSAVKNGGAKLNALLTITARSLLTEDLNSNKTLWGVFPSSNSTNTDQDVLSDFTHRLRTTVTRAQHTKRGVPLFIRHTVSQKRSLGSGVSRYDPTNQMTTLHLNPVYRASIVDKHVIVIDDCTTYGLSFGVAAAFLRAAKASKVTGIALGKFGNTINTFNVSLSSDPFKPVPASAFTHTCTSLIGANSPVAQAELLDLL